MIFTYVLHDLATSNLVAESREWLPFGNILAKSAEQRAIDIIENMSADRKLDFSSIGLIVVPPLPEASSQQAKAHQKTFIIK